MKLAACATEASRPTRALQRAVFIDKDGTLIQDVPYNVDPAKLQLAPHAVQALRRLREAGWLLVVISNQPGIALRRFDLPALEALGGALKSLLASHGIELDGMYVCPHAPAGRDDPRPACRCRKPAPGLLLEAANDLGIDLRRSWMVGDILNDVEAGWRAGCGTVFLDVGNETEWHWSPIRIPDFRVGDLDAAADAILSAPGSRRTRGVPRRPTLRRPSGAAVRVKSAA